MLQDRKIEDKKISHQMASKKQWAKTEFVCKIRQARVQIYLVEIRKPNGVFVNVRISLGSI